jgi:hypothetical protein
MAKLTAKKLLAVTSIMFASLAILGGYLHFKYDYYGSFDPILGYGEIIAGLIVLYATWRLYKK